MSAIAEALVVTAVGIAVARAVAAYNHLQRRVEHVLAGVEVLSNLILAHLESDVSSGGSSQSRVHATAEQQVVGAPWPGTQFHDANISGINVTPLVDVTLVLLIIFIVTAEIVVTPAVPLDLPRAVRGRNCRWSFRCFCPKTVVFSSTEAWWRIKSTLQASGRSTQKRQQAARRDSSRWRCAAPRIAILNTLKRAGVSRIAFGPCPRAR